MPCQLQEFYMIHERSEQIATRAELLAVRWSCRDLLLVSAGWLRPCCPASWHPSATPRRARTCG